MKAALDIADALEIVISQCNNHEIKTNALNLIEDLKKVLKESEKIQKNAQNKTTKIGKQVISVLKIQKIMCPVKDCIQYISSKKYNTCIHCHDKKRIATSVVELLKIQNIICSTKGCLQCVSPETHNLCTRCNDIHKMTERIEKWCTYIKNYDWEWPDGDPHLELLKSYRDKITNQCFKKKDESSFVFVKLVYKNSDKDCMFMLAGFQRFRSCPEYMCVYDVPDLIKMSPTDFFHEYTPIGVGILPEDTITFKAGDKISKFKKL